MNTIKQHTYLFLLALASLSSLPGCSADDLPGSSPEGTNSAPASSFQIHVTDGGYASADAKPGTRAEENDYKTVFTEGDRIGVFAVKGNKVVDEVNNLCLTASNGNGSIVWKDNEGKAPIMISGATYYAYYPYQQSLTGDLPPGATDAAGFFANVITNWSIATDQDTYAKYTAQDLMIAKGTLSGKELSFSMQHQMALVVIDLPRTEYKLTTDQNYTWLTDAPGLHFTNFSPCRMSDGTYRYLVKPSTGSFLSGSYTNTISKTWQFNPSISASRYKIYKVDGGSNTKIEKKYTLQVGDFYMKDGSLLAGSTSQLSNEQKADIVGIVFWVGDATAKDQTLSNDHKDCTHGLVVALKDAVDGEIVWQSSYSSVQNWLNDNNKSGVYLSVASGTSNSDPLNNIQGYNNTKAIEEFNAAIGVNLVQAVEKVVEYRDAVPVPNNSSQWYLPSEKELTLLCGSDVDDIWSNNSGGTANRDLINGKLNSISSVETQILSDFYWSSTERSYYYAFYVNFGSGNVGNTYKSYAYRVRCVLAF